MKVSNPKGHQYKYEAAMKCVRNATSVIPTFVNDKNKFVQNLGGHKFCCFLCACKDAGLPMPLAQHVFDNKMPMVHVLYEMEELLEMFGENWNGNPIEFIEKMKKFQAKKLSVICENMLEKYGNRYDGFGLAHPNYLTTDKMFFRLFRHPGAPDHDGYLRIGQAVLFYECKANSNNSKHFLRKVIRKFNRPRGPEDADWLYTDIEGMETQECHVISTRPRWRCPDTEQDGVYFNDGDVMIRLGMYPTIAMPSNPLYASDGASIGYRSFLKIEELIKKCKDGDYPNNRVIILDKLPRVYYRDNCILNTTGVWLKMYKRIYGSLQNLLMVFVVDVDDFSDNLGTTNVTVLNEFVTVSLNIGEKIEIISIDATRKDPKFWKLLPSKWTF